MNEEIELTNVMLEAAAVAAPKWPKGVECGKNWQHSDEHSLEPGCG
jgi:hypothetical protein